MSREPLWLVAAAAVAISCGRVGYAPSARDAAHGFDVQIERSDGDRPATGGAAGGVGGGVGGVGGVGGGVGGGSGGGPMDGGNGDLAASSDGGPGGCAPRTLCALVDDFTETALSSQFVAYSDGTCTTDLSGGAFRVTVTGAVNRFCGLGSVGQLTPLGTLAIDSAGFTTATGFIVYFQLQDASSYVEFQLRNTTLNLNVDTPAGLTVKASMAYDPVAHRYWRFRADAASIAYETSPDQNTWTTQATAAPPFASGSVQMDFGAGFFMTGGPMTISLPGVNAP